MPGLSHSHTHSLSISQSLLPKQIYQTDLQEFTTLKQIWDRFEQLPVKPILSNHGFQKNGLFLIIDINKTQFPQIDEHNKTKRVFARFNLITF